MTNGAYTNIAWAFLAVPGINTAHTLQVKLNGSSIEVWWDGTRQLQYNDPYNQTATRHGLRWFNQYDAGSTFEQIEIDGTLPPPIARVVVTPGTGVVPFHQTVTLTAQAFDTHDMLIPNVSFAWATSNAAAVSIAAAGTNTANVTGQGMGAATITATPTSGPSGTASISDDPGTTLVFDSFADFDRVLLTAHWPEMNQDGQPWTVVGSPVPVIGNQQATIAAGTDAMALMDAGAADGSVKVDWTPGGAFGGLVVRARDAQNYLTAYFANHSVYWARIENGAWTNLASSYLGAPSPTPHHFEVKLAGASIEVWFDGTRLMSLNEPFNVTSTTHGLRWFNQWDATSTFDNFEVDGTCPPLVHHVVIGATSTEVPFRTSATLTATAYDASNVVIPNVGFVWTTSNPAAIALTATGTNTATVTGMGDGASTITATQTRGPSGSIVLTDDPITVKVFDSFTAADGTLLTAHLPEVRSGATWAVASGPIPTLLGGHAAVEAGTMTVATVDAGIADGTVKVDWIANGIFGGLVVRLRDAQHYLAAYFSTHSVYLSRVDNGVWTTLGSSYLGVPSAIAHPLEVRLNGTAIEVWFDGVRQIQWTDPFDVTATRHGIFWSNPWDAVSTFDNFEVDGTLQPLVDHLVITPGPATVLFGGSGVLTATAYDASNVVIPNASVAWSVNNGAVSVIPIGANTAIISGFANGTSTITATPARGAAGSTTVTVDPGRVLVHDRFTAVTGTAIDSHVPDIRPGASMWIPGGTPVATLTNNAATIASGTDALALIDATVADGIIGVDWTSVGYGGLIVRATDASNYLLASFANHSVYWSRVTSGTQTVLASAYLGAPAPGTHHLEMRLAGPAVEIWRDNVRVLQTSESFNQTATLHGIKWVNQCEVASTFDNFDVRRLTAIAHVTVNPAFVALPVGSTQTVAAYAYDANNNFVPDASFTWQIADPAVAAWTTAGFAATVSGLNAGHTMLTATAFGSPASAASDVWVAPTCVYALFPSSASIGADGGTSTATISAPAGCGWSTGSDSNWLRPTATSGSGAIVLTYTVDANGGGARTGTLSIAGLNFAVSQDAVGSTGGGTSSCAYSLTPQSATVSASGGSGQFNVTTSSGCAWETQTSATWIHATGSGNGNGTVTYVIDGNVGQPPRTGVLTVGPTIHTVVQGGDAVGDSETIILGPTIGGPPNPVYGVVTNGFDSPTAALTSELGAGIVRVTFPWFQMEPNRGDVRFDPANPIYDITWDNWVENARSRGLEIFATIAYAPDWASGHTNGCTGCAPLNIEDWKQFVAKVAAHFGDRVKYFGIWNEPNDTNVFLIGGDTAGVLYHQLASAARDAIKSVDPSLNVVGPDTSGPGFGKFVSIVTSWGQMFSTFSAFTIIQTVIRTLEATYFGISFRTRWAKRKSCGSQKLVLRACQRITDNDGARTSVGLSSSTRRESRAA